VTQEFFRLVFVLIAPQNKHRRLSPNNPEKLYVPINKLNNLVNRDLLCGAKCRVARWQGDSGESNNEIAKCKVRFIDLRHRRNAHEPRICEDEAAEHA
jgi:hypothetical protein